MIIIMIIISDIIKSRSIVVVVVELPHARQIIMAYRGVVFHRLNACNPQYH